MKSISVYGEPGSYSELAALKHFPKTKTRLKYIGFLPELFKSVEGTQDLGVVPIENSLEGAVTQTYDLLLKSDLFISAEQIIPISHCLIAQKGMKLSDVKYVYSHQQALGQCREYLEGHGMRPVPFYDTAGSVKMLKESRRSDSAAIASEIAAKTYGMKVLERNIQSVKHNYTRFIIISKDAHQKSGNKTTIAFSAKHKPGSLFRALNCFYRNKINLLFIQSRPIPGMAWEYNFYVDCDKGINDAGMRNAIKQLYGASDFVKILGSYKRARFESYA
jgi:prephenate dehydratase